jgi:spore coat protein A
MAKYTLFDVALPIPSLSNDLRIDATEGGTLEIGIGETQHFAGLYDNSGNKGEENKLYTTIWGFGQIDPESGDFTPTWPGPTIMAREYKLLTVTFYNELPANGYPGGHLLPFDTTYHTIREAVEDLSLIPTNVHLHGGHTDANSDGFPETVFYQGESFDNFYDNSQQASTLWDHPHTLGRTRQDIYAGLVGFYFLRDENENELISKGHLPGEDYEIELSFQDRMFTDDGQLYLPSSSDEFYAPGELEELRVELQDFLEGEGILEAGEDLPPAPDVTGLPEFFGDHNLTNGVVWPHLEVEETQYRFRLLNSSDSRAYVFEIQDDQLGSPGGDRMAPSDFGQFPS